MPDPRTALSPRTASLFAAHDRAIVRRTDRMFAALFVLEWLAGIVAALLSSPYTWMGSARGIHPHVWAAVVLGGAIIAFPLVMIFSYAATAATRHAVAIGQMLMSALLIHLTGGRIETHFHVF